MARIPDAELERLKGEVSLARLIEAQGHRLISQGKDLACRCPWHEGDDTPSCIVTPATNLWHCFGCNAGGTVIDWVMRSHRISFRHACELLLREHPALAAGAAGTGSPGAAPKLSAGKLRQVQSFALPASTDESAADQLLLDQVIEFYHETLLASPEALAYLERRGLGSREMIERLRVGYALTAHKAQGASVERAYVLAHESLSAREWSYVAGSRAREAVHLYAERTTAADLERIMGRSHKKDTALDYAQSVSAPQPAMMKTPVALER